MVKSYTFRCEEILERQRSANVEMSEWLEEITGDRKQGSYEEKMLNFLLCYLGMYTYCKEVDFAVINTAIIAWNCGGLRAWNYNKNI